MSPLDTELFDERIAEWLEDDPDAAPSQVLEVVRAAVPSVTQRRRSIVARPLPLAARLGLGVAAVVAVLVLGTRLFRPPGHVGGEPSLTPGPSATASPGPTAAPQLPTARLQPYTSALYGYSVGYPVEWLVTPATSRLPTHGTPWAVDPTVDLFERRAGAPVTAQGGPYGTIVIASAVLEDAETLDAWTAIMPRGLCGEPARTDAIEVDGEPALLLDYAGGCNQLFHIWVTVVHQGTGTHIIWLDDPGREPADRAFFNRILASFAFPTPAASPTPRR
jgi:hypothetical protein